MANALYYWDGKNWQPVSGGGGGAAGPAGPPGPAGPAGDSIEVYGPQPDEPTAPDKGDIWISVPVKAIPVTRLAGRKAWRPGKYLSLKKRSS